MAPIGQANLKQYMSEVVFMRYWRFACIPGIYGGVEETALDAEGRTALYQVGSQHVTMLFVICLFM